MKWIIALFITLLMIVGVGLKVAYYPYQFYNQVIIGGSDSRYLNLGPFDKKYLAPEEFGYQRAGEKLSRGSFGSSFWREFQFSSFLLPIPVRHPGYLFIPNIELNEKSGETTLGIKISDSNKKVLLEYFPRKKKKLNFSFSEVKLFKIPYFRSYLNEKTNSVIWKDIFTKKISLLEKGSRDWSSYLKYLKSRDYKELVYNLYILMLRERVFPKTIKSFSYVPDRSFGVFRYHDNNSRMSHEEYLWENKGVAEIIEIKARNYDPQGDFLREKYIKNMKYNETDHSMHVALYAEFKNLPYRRQIDQEGLVFLYTAWSHQIYKREFLRDMISFLERGKGNYIHLRPIYEYSLLKYGTTFSTEDRRESAIEKMKREEAEETKKALEKAKRDQGESEEEIDNMSRDERLNYYLKEAKEKGSDIDEESDSIEGI